MFATTRVVSISLTITGVKNIVRFTECRYIEVRYMKVPLYYRKATLRLLFTK